MEPPERSPEPGAQSPESHCDCTMTKDEGGGDNRRLTSHRRRPTVLSTCLVSVFALLDTSVAFRHHETTHLSTIRKPRRGSERLSSALLATTDSQEDKKKNRISFLCKNIGMSEDQANCLLQKRPQLLRYSQRKTIETTDFFLSEVGLSKEEYIKMALLYPSVFMYSVKNRLRPTIAFFRDEIGSSKWRWVVRRYPQVFSHSVDTLRLRARFMNEKLGLKRWADLSQIASKFPPVFWLPEENILSKMQYLKETLHLSTSELRDIIVTYPQLLG